MLFFVGDWYGLLYARSDNGHDLLLLVCGWKQRLVYCKVPPLVINIDIRLLQERSPKRIHRLVVRSTDRKVRFGSVRIYRVRCLEIERAIWQHHIHSLFRIRSRS